MSLRKTRVLGLLQIMALALNAGAQPTNSSAITPWPETQIPPGSLTAVDSQRLVVSPLDPSQPVQVLGWQHVQHIGPELHEHLDSLAAGHSIRRARDRLQRGDWAGARDLLAAQRARFQTETGETSAAFHAIDRATSLTGLDRRGATLAWLHQRRSESSASPETELGPFFSDSANASMPGPALRNPTDPIESAYTLAIAWEDTSAANRPRHTDSYLAQADGLFETAQRLTGWQRVSLLCVAAYAGSESTRDQAQRALAPLADADDELTSTWARFALARARALDTNPSMIRRGIAGYLEVSIRDRSRAPILAGLALHEAAQAATRLGEAESAAALRLELTRRFPDHPAGQPAISLDPQETDA